MRSRHITNATNEGPDLVKNGAPLLCAGDRLTQPEFHRRYELYPEKEKFELIAGMVFMTPRHRWRHAKYLAQLSLPLGFYESETPGTEVLNNTTTILGEESEPQPDLTLRILAEFGGQSRDTKDGYVEGAAELLAEIAYSSRAIDLHLKRFDYQRAGVLEYLVLCVEEEQLHWFRLKSGRHILPDAQGIYRSRVFPGLWIDGPALLAGEAARVLHSVRSGLASPEHAAFVKRLQAAHRE